MPARRRVRKPTSKRGIPRQPEDIPALVSACATEIEREFKGKNLDPETVRREVIMRLRYTHHLTWAQIGDAFGISGERARQLSRVALRGRAVEDFAGAFRLGHSPSASSPLSPQEKSRIVAAFYELMVAVATGSTSVRQAYDAFQTAYRGDSRAFVEGFSACRTDADRERWVHQLVRYLRQEIEGAYWKHL